MGQGGTVVIQDSAALWDAAVRLAEGRGAPFRCNFSVLVPFWFVATVTSELPALILQPSATGLGLVSATLLTAMGYAFLRRQKQRRITMIRHAHDELLEKARNRAIEIIDRDDAEAERALPRGERQRLQAARQLLELQEIASAQQPGPFRKHVARIASR